jgi:hypothetical protein
MDDILYTLKPLMRWFVQGGWIWVGLVMLAVTYWALKGR